MHRTRSITTLPTESITTFIAAAIAAGPGATRSTVFADYIAEARRRGMTAVLDYAASNLTDAPAGA